MKILQAFILGIMLMLTGCVVAPPAEMTPLEQQQFTYNQYLDSAEVYVSGFELYVVLSEDEWDADKRQQYTTIVNGAKAAIKLGREFVAAGDFSAATGQQKVINGVIQTIIELKRAEGIKEDTEVPALPE